MDPLKTVIFGGSFNPPHVGHVSMIMDILFTRPDVGKILVVPCHQQEGKDLVLFGRRLQMCRRTFEGLPLTSVTAVEYDLGGISYTYRLIEHLQKTRPSRNFVLALGEDLRDKVSSWKHWEKVTIPVWFFPRVGPSSTQIREELKSQGAGAYTKRSVCKSVEEYITKHRLYQ